MKKLLFLCSLLFASLASADTAFQNYYPPAYVWASKPTCAAAIAGMQIRVTDVGDTDFIATCDGTRWGWQGPIVFSAAPNYASLSQTAEQIMAVVTIPGGLAGPNGFFEVNTVFLYTSAAGKIERIQIGDTGSSGSVGGSAPTGTCASSLVVESIGTTTLATRKEYRWHNFGATNAQKAMDNANNEISAVFTTSTPVTCNVETATEWKIFIDLSKSTAGDPATLEWYQVRIWYGA